MTDLAKYLRHSQCGRAAYGIRRACIASKVGLVRRNNMFIILGQRFSMRAIGYAIFAVTTDGTKGVQIVTNEPIPADLQIRELLKVKR